jgi:hypothetical protein
LTDLERRLAGFEERIGRLVALCASLFVGGWLYQELTASTTGPQARES